MNLQTAKCERSGEAIPLSEGCYVATPGNGEWSFIAVEQEMHGDYCIPVSEMTKSPETFIHWMAHINQKPWFDGQKFAEFFTRFRRANALH